MKMRKDEMPYRLREFLPVFAPDGAKFADQIAGLAVFLGKQVRTIEAYISTREDRTISADDYMKVATDWVIRKSRTSMEPGFLVLDYNGDQLYETVWLWQAMFLGDVDTEAADIRVRQRGQWQFNQLTDVAKRRSRLRRLVREQIVSKDEICQIFDFDKYCLVDYQLEHVDWLSTPDELRLSAAEALMNECMGLAA